MSDQCPICKLALVNGVCPVAGKCGRDLEDLAWPLRGEGGISVLIDAWGCHVRAEERERCAKVCEDHDNVARDNGLGMANQYECADAIRALGPTAHHEGDKVRRLIEAATDASRWLQNPHDGDAVGVFEDINDWFMADTGLMRPGKDYPAGDPPPDDLQEQWDAWRIAKGRAVRGALRQALADIRRK